MYLNFRLKPSIFPHACSELWVLANWFRGGLWCNTDASNDRETILSFWSGLTNLVLIELALRQVCHFKHQLQNTLIHSVLLVLLILVVKQYIKYFQWLKHTFFVRLFHIVTNCLNHISLPSLFKLLHKLYDELLCCVNWSLFFQLSENYLRYQQQHIFDFMQRLFLIFLFIVLVFILFRIILLLNFLLIDDAEKWGKDFGALVH